MFGGCDGFFYGQAVEREVDVRLGIEARRIGYNAFLGIEALFAHVATLHEGHDRQAEVLGKGVVAAIVSRNSHNGAGAVAREHIVAHPNGVGFAGEGVDGVAAGEHACHFLVDHTLALGALLHLVEVGINLSLLGGCGEFCHEFALRSEHHECNAKHSVGASGEYGEMLVAVLHLEFYFGTFGASYPVALGFLDAIGPVEAVEAVEQAL